MYRETDMQFWLGKAEAEMSDLCSCSRMTESL